jgi:Glycine rich protein
MSDRGSSQSRDPLGGPTALRYSFCALIAVAAALIATPVSSASANSVTFNYKGGSQAWTVPAGVTRIGVDAEGGAGAGDYGGLGGWTHAVLSVQPGQQLTVMVGGAGNGITAGFNGGGDGGWNDGGRAGGGASDVRTGEADLDDRVVVAGGGGGSAPGAGPIYGVGGSGGGLIGGGGGAGDGSYAGGGGGTQESGGQSGGSWGSDGSFGQGAEGGYAAGAGGWRLVWRGQRRQ